MLPGKKEEERKIIPKILDNLFRSIAQGQHTLRSEQLEAYSPRCKTLCCSTINKQPIGLLHSNTWLYEQVNLKKIRKKEPKDRAGCGKRAKVVRTDKGSNCFTPYQHLTKPTARQPRFRRVSCQNQIPMLHQGGCQKPLYSGQPTFFEIALLASIKAISGGFGTKCIV